MVAGDAYNGYILAYDGARLAWTALLAQQGLRASTSGGRYAVERTVLLSPVRVLPSIGGGEQVGLTGLGHTAACPATRCLAEHGGQLALR